MACKSSLLNKFSTCLSHFVSQKVRLKKDHTQKHVSLVSHVKKFITPVTKKMDHTRDSKKKKKENVSHPRFFA